MEQYATAGVLSAHVPSLGAGAGKRNEVSKMQNYRNAKLFVKTGESNNMTLTKHYKNQIDRHLENTYNLSVCKLIRNKIIYLMSEHF